MQRKPSHATTKLTLFSVSKDEWDTKEDTTNSSTLELTIELQNDCSIRVNKFCLVLKEVNAKVIWTPWGPPNV